jgi:hypothetical protein
MITNIPFSIRMFIILSLGLGGASGSPDDSTPQSPSRGMDVDYVRVFQRV